MFMDLAKLHALLRSAPEIKVEPPPCLGFEVGAELWEIVRVKMGVEILCSKVVR